MTFATHHEFQLPLGYADAAGRLHVRGVMRLATALDEVEPLGDARVKDNEAFFGILLLSRVTLRLGEFAPVPPEVIAGLYAADFAHLQALYAAINVPGSAGAGALAAPLPPVPSAPPASIETECPHCGAELILDLDPAPLPDIPEVPLR